MIGGAGEGTVGLFDHLSQSAPTASGSTSPSANSRFEKKRNGVLRLKWSDKAAGAFWLGKDEAGADDPHFNARGAGHRRQGNLYVCDWGNNRVMVFSRRASCSASSRSTSRSRSPSIRPAERSMSCPAALAPKWGRLVENASSASSRPGARGAEGIGQVGQRRLNVMALDGAAAPPSCGSTGPGAVPRDRQGRDSFEAGRTGRQRAAAWTAPGSSPATLPATACCSMRSTTAQHIVQMDLATGKKSPFCKGTDMALDRDGNVYAMGGHGTMRSTASIRPASRCPSPATGSNKIVTKGYRGLRPEHGACRALPSTPQGHLRDAHVQLRRRAMSTAAAWTSTGPTASPRREASSTAWATAIAAWAWMPRETSTSGPTSSRPTSLSRGLHGQDSRQGLALVEDADREVPWCYTVLQQLPVSLGRGVQVRSRRRRFLRPERRDPRGTRITASPSPPTAGQRPGRRGLLPLGLPGLRGQGGRGPVALRRLRDHPSSGDCLTGPTLACVCRQSHLAVDEYGRVFAPNVFRFSVEMLDTNGNQLARIGRYGNADSAGPGAASCPSRRSALPGRRSFPRPEARSTFPTPSTGG